MHFTFGRRDLTPPTTGTSGNVRQHHSRSHSQKQNEQHGHWLWSRPLGFVPVRAFKKRRRADSGHDASSTAHHSPPSSYRQPPPVSLVVPSPASPAVPSPRHPSSPHHRHPVGSAEDDQPSATDDPPMPDTRSLHSAYSGYHATPSLISNMSARAQHFHIGTPQSLHHRFRRRLSCGSSSNVSHHTNRSIHSSSSSSSSSSHDDRRVYRGHPPPLHEPTRRTGSASGRSMASIVTQSWSHRRARLLSVDQQLPDFETQVFCPTCEKWVQSRIRYRLGPLVWLVSFILFACTVVLFWVPFYVKYFKDVVHYCPGCGTCIGRHSNL